MKIKKLFPFVLLSFLVVSCGGTGVSSEIAPSSSEEPQSEPEQTSAELPSEVSQEEESKDVTSEEPVSEAHVHNWQVHYKLLPTCTEDGHEEYYSCTGCDELLDEDEEPIQAIPVIDKLGHTEDLHYVTLTEGAKVIDETYCSVCNTKVSAAEEEDVLEVAAGKTFRPMQYIDVEGSLTISYTFAGSTSDWGCELFRSGDYWIAAGCIGYKPETMIGDQDQLCDLADGQGQDGEFSINTDWSAVIGAGNYSLTLCENGDIYWYKGNDLALYFYRDHVSFWKPTGELNTAAKFVPALLEAFKTNGMRVSADGVSNVSISYEATHWGFEEIKYVDAETEAEITTSYKIGPVKAGSSYEVACPDVVGYSLDATENNPTVGSVRAGKANETIVVKYNKVPATILTFEYYAGSQENPAGLLGTVQKAEIEGTEYEYAHPDYDFYKTPAGKESGTFPGEDGTIKVYGYEFDHAYSLDSVTYGQAIPALPDINASTGVYVSFDINSRDLGGGEEANGDWSTLFESENYRCYTGCHGLIGGSNSARLYDLAHGNPGDFGEPWNALVSYGRTNRLTFAYFPDGSMKAYRDSKLVLYWHSDVVADNDGSKTAADFVSTFVNDVHTKGFKFADLITTGVEKNNGRSIRNVSIGKATDIVENATVNIMNGSELVFSYTANLFNHDKFLGAQAPFGYKINSYELNGSVLTVNVEEVAYTMGGERITDETGVVCDQKYDAGGWWDRLYNIQGIEEGDFYLEANLTDFAVNDYAGGHWKGMLVTFVSDMLAVAGNNAWAEKTFCLGNNGNWGTQTFPAVHVLTVNTETNEWANANRVELSISRTNRLYVTTLKLFNGDNQIATGYFAAIGVNFKLDTIYLSAEFAKFTVKSLQFGTLSE